jgi:hypothetical protein
MVWEGGGGALGAMRSKPMTSSKVQERSPVVKRCVCGLNMQNAVVQQVRDG